MDWIIRPCRVLRGSIRVPGDKSISHRVALLASLAKGFTRIEGYPQSDDCLGMLTAMASMGAKVHRRGGRVEVEGFNGSPRSPAGPIDCGNSGTAMRLLAGFTAGLPVVCQLTGDDSLRQRPMDRVIEPLRKMGADIVSLGGGGRAPLRIRGGCLRGITYSLPMASAQVKSCLLLAGLHAAGTTEITEPEATRDHTERIFSFLGLSLAISGNTIGLPGSAGGVVVVPARQWRIPGDFSSAAFWLAGAAVHRQADVTVSGVGINPRRTALLDVLRRMGAVVRVERRENTGWEPMADLSLAGGPALRGVTVQGGEIANLIDEIPVLCAAAAQAKGETRILDAAELRVKESDRIASIISVLRSFGVPCADLGEGISLTGVERLRGGGEIDSNGDHRIAMMAAIMALSADRPVRIRNVGCVDTSYPGFRRHLRRLTEGLTGL